MHRGKGLPSHSSLQSLPECFTSTAGFRQGHFNDLYIRNDSYKVFLLERNNHNPFCMWTLRMQWLTASLRHQAQTLRWEGKTLAILWIITDVIHMRAKQTLLIITSMYSRLQVNQYELFINNNEIKPLLCCLRVTCWFNACGGWIILLVTRLPVRFPMTI